MATLTRSEHIVKINGRNWEAERADQWDDSTVWTVYPRTSQARKVGLVRVAVSRGGVARCDGAACRGRCKHVAALEAAGLIAPKPTPETAPALEPSAGVSMKLAEVLAGEFLGPDEHDAWLDQVGACEAPRADDSDPASWPSWCDEPALSLLDPTADRLDLVDALVAIRDHFRGLDNQLGACSPWRSASC